MTTGRKNLLCLCLCVLIPFAGVKLLGGLLPGDMGGWNDRVFDRYHKERVATGKDTPAANIVMVDVDDRSYRELGRQLTERNTYAHLVEVLTEAGVKAILFDLVFSLESDQENDAALEMALATQGNTYLPLVVGIHEGQPGPGVDDATPYTLPVKTASWGDIPTAYQLLTGHNIPGNHRKMLDTRLPSCGG